MNGALQFFIVPKFSEAKALSEFLARLAWYMSPFRAREFQITCILDASLYLAVKNRKISDWAPDYFDPATRSFLDALDERLILVSDDAMQGTRMGINHLVVWNAQEFQREFGRGVDYITKIYQAVQGGHIPSHNFDVHNNPFERRHFIDCFDSLFGTYDIAANRGRFNVLCTLLSLRTDVGVPVVIGRPPAQNEMKDVAKKASVLICMNNAIYQEDIVNADVPLVFTFMDAAMAGCSLFGARFRERLAQAMTHENAWLLTWDIYEPYIAPVLSEAARKRAVFMPRESVPFPCADINTDMQTRFVSSDSWNVATSLAVPLASTVFDKFYLYGLDGKSSTEERWSPTVPGKSDDDTFQMAHPFGRRDIPEKYRFHEQTLAGLLAKLLAEGKEVKSLTPSNFAAVQALYTDA